MWSSGFSQTTIRVAERLAPAANTRLAGTPTTMHADRLIRNVSDTARWAAVYRADETDRPDALFRDRFARRLAGARGAEIASSLPPKSRQAWAWVTRTWLFDQRILEQVAAGADLVVNLAAGLDARPYRMALPPTLPWVEVDLPDLLAYKEDVLRDERPVCQLERVPLDLADVAARRALLARLDRRAKKAVIVTEGLLIYLAPDEVGSLARDLATPEGFQRWILDLASPGLLRLLTRQLGDRLSEAGAPLKFGPAEGPGFFAQHGWRPIAVQSMLKTARTLRRLSPWMRLLSFLPASSGRQGSQPWSGVCLLERQ